MLSEPHLILSLTFVVHIYRGHYHDNFQSYTGNEKGHRARRNNCQYQRVLR